MLLSAFLLVIFAAVLHALWNFVTKKVSGNLSVLYFGLLFGCIILLPTLFFFSPTSVLVASTHLFLVATGIIHAFYFFLLSKAYKSGNISTVYPIARGSGVIGTTTIAIFLVGDTISLFGIIGVLCTAAGILFIGLRGNEQLEYYRGVILALLVGATIACYSIVDKMAVQLIQPVVYIFGLFFFTMVFLTPYMVLSRRDELRAAWETLKRYSLIIGAGAASAYLIILYTFRIAPVSYVVAVRELSVAFGALLGICFLREPLSAKKAIGLILIVFGLVMIKIA
jgi:drug/metabolite transporter (DMT)-like permease